MLKAAALIPAFNEARTIRAVVEGTIPHVARVIVVDDGSTDGTRQIALDAGAEVLTHAANRGKGHAIRTALQLIFQSDFTHILMLDGDMQHLPHEAPSLLRAAEATGADLVLGERRFDRGGMPASRFHANRIGSRVLSWFVGVPIRDTQCGFRVVRVSALRQLKLSARGFEIETEMLVKLGRLLATMATVPVTAVYNDRLSKLRPVRDTTRTCFLAVYYRFIEPM